MSKRYLVYHGKHPIQGINGYDSRNAIEKARRLHRARGGKVSEVRVRLANKGLLKSLAEQGEYNG